MKKNPSRTKHVRMPSSSPILLITMLSPSMASRRPATNAATIERVSSFATKYTSSTVAVPTSATMRRHAALLPGPNSPIPSAMIHLPSGGCTTKLPVPVSELVSPVTNASFAPSPQVPS